MAVTHWGWVRRTASSSRNPFRGKCSLAASQNDFPASIMIVLGRCPAFRPLLTLMSADVLRRMFLAPSGRSVERQQEQAASGAVRQEIVGTYDGDESSTSELSLLGRGPYLARGPCRCRHQQLSSQREVIDEPVPRSNI